MSKDKNNSENGTSPGIDALDSILEKESAKASNERKEITRALKEQEDQRRSEEKAELEARRNALLAERQEALRRRQSQLQNSTVKQGSAAPVDAETTRMIPGGGTGVHRSSRMGLYIVLVCLAGGGVAFATLGPKSGDQGPEATSQSSETQKTGGGPTAVITNDASHTDTSPSDGVTATSDAGTQADGQSAGKDTKVVITPKEKPKPRIVRRRKPRSTKTPKTTPGGNGEGGSEIIKLRRGLGGR